MEAAVNIKIRMFFSIVLLACVAFSSAQPTRADSLLIAPNANAATSGNANQSILLSEGAPPLTFQWDLAASQLTAMMGDTIDAIGFRLASASSNVTGPTTIGTFDLQLSSSLNPIGSLSGTPVNNIGPDAVTVYAGSLVLGSLTGGAGPNPFFLINFVTPFTYTGGDLLMTENVANAPAIGTVFVDANFVDSLGDTSSTLNGGEAQFFNYPITEFEYSPSTAVPEPSAVLLLGIGLLAVWVLRLRHTLE
jgi:PEP-CTERM motif